ncbi:MAG: hypothetical protein EA427_06895 [Spirochaetaceae bacterium]|nr:MAG: hypothetical protein EA427_06895 [Spirochaetaceae bacterium]
MDQLWSDLETEVRRFVRRLLLEALLYPVTILLAASVGALVLAGYFPDALDTERALRDLWWGVAGVTILSMPLTGRYRLFRLRQEWYRAFARVTHHLEKRPGLVHALEYAARSGTAPFRGTLADAAGDCACGTAPAEALRNRGCPREIYRCIALGTSERNVVIRLREAFQERSEKIRRRMAPAERLAPAAAITVVGLLLLWIVVRLVLPVLEMLYTGGMYG